MGAQEASAEEALRTAAAEVSTSSTTRRLRLFRHTLPHLLAKASESPSDTTLLVDLIFQTLLIYDDRASRKAVDDMVIQALGESTFMKPFAASLVQCMEKNMKVTSPLACFKLLRWSCYLLNLSQFAMLSKGGFSRLANAQAVLCQVLMDGSFRQRRTCKQLFTRLFSESMGTYKMYIDEIRDSRIPVRDSPAFLNIMLDFAITSPSLYAEYKPLFLDLYVKTILGSKDRPSQASAEAFKPLFLDMGHEDFKNIVVPSCIKMLKRNPEIVLQSIGYLLNTVRLDLSKYCMEFLPVVLHQARHSVEERRIIALSTVGTLSGKSSDPDTLLSMFNAIKAILGGSEGKLSIPYQRIGMINALEQLSRSPPKQISRLAPSLSSFLLTCYKDDGIEEVKLAVLSALGSWASVSTETVQADVVSFIAAGLKEKDTLRKGHLKLIRAICKKSDSLTKVTSLLDQLIQLSKTGFTKATQRLDGIYALFSVSRLAAIDTKAGSKSFSLCSHYCSWRENVYFETKRLQRRLKQQKIFFIELISPNISVICKELLSLNGLFSSNKQVQCAALNSLSTLMTITPSDAFLEFEKHFIGLPDLTLHDGFSENDIKILYTPEGQLSTEQGIYVAEAVASKNTKLAKGRFRAYDDQDTDSAQSGAPTKSDRRESSSIGKRETGKSTKKTAPADKAKTAKEEARDLLLKEEASVREKIGHVQKNLSLMLDALGELAIANPIFTHGQLPSLVNYVEPLLSSPIVSDAAFRAMLNLARCTAPPLCNWAPEIAAAIRVIAVDDFKMVMDLMPVIVEEDSNKKSSPGLFEQIVTGLTVACKAGPLPADSFTFVFPVLYHVLSTVPAYHPSVGPMLNELCLGLKSNDLAQALVGVYAKEVHVRLACLTAIKCIPSHSVQRDLQVSTSLWIAAHDPEKVVAELAEELWDRFGFDVFTDYSGIFDALSHKNYNVRAAAAEALAAALDENLDKMQDTLSTLFSLYIRDLGAGVEFGDIHWLGRQGVALALHSLADVLGSKDLPVVMTFLISRALADPNVDVRGRMINAGILIIDKHGKENVPLLFPIFESYLNKKASDEEKYDLVREGVVIFTGALAKHLSKDDPKVHSVVEKLLDVLNTPSEAVQRAVSDCLSPLMVSKQEEAQALVSRLLDRMMKCEKYGERRGAAFGLAGVVKGFGISSLKKYGIAAILQQGLEDRASAKSREGALLGFECLCEKLGKLFEPYVIQMLPLLLVSFSDQVLAVRESAECAARAMMSQLTGHGVKLVLPSLLKGLEDKAWRTKQSSVQLLGAMAYCAPQQLSQCLPKIVPKLTEVLTDTHPKVQAAGQTALQQVGSVIKNPEISALVPILLSALTDPNNHTKHSLDILLQTTFINSIDAPSLALLVPIVHRGLRERGVDTKKKAAQIVGNMSSLVTEPKDMIPYIGLLLPEVKKVLVDPIPEVRAVAARALGSLIIGMGEEIFPDLVPWLLDTLKSDSSNVERSLPLLLPAIEDGIFSDNWRIRQSSVELLGDLLFKVAGTSGKAILEGGSDDEGASTEAHGRAIIDVLGREKRNEVLAAIYMVRSDVSLTVRQAALHVWKTIVANTPRTLKEIMPVLMDTLISSLASSSSERRQVAGRSLGELVRKLGERVLPSIIPILSQGLKDPDASRRQGVCIGLSEVMGSAGKHQLLSFMDLLIPTIRTALCDSTQEVRESAGLAFSTLYKSAGLQAIDEIVPTLLRALEDDETSATALDGLKQILSSFNAHALGALAEVAGPGLNSHIGTVLPALILAMDDEDADVQNSARKAAETVVLVIDEEGIETLIPELLKGVNDSQASMRRGSAYLIGFLFKNSKLYLADEAPDIMSTLITLLSDTDKATVSVSTCHPAALEAFSRVVSSVPKEQLPTHIKLVRDAVSTARDKERRRRKGVPILVPGLCLPKALQPFLPIFQQGLISGSAETKEQAAEGLGELIDVTSEKTLKEVVVPITGPLIRILGDRFPWQVKSAILSTLTIIISKGGLALKPFLPQLQTTFVKCLQDNNRLVLLSFRFAVCSIVLPPLTQNLNNRSVRTRAASALGKLSALSTRVDPLVSDLLSMLQSGDDAVKESVLSALKGVVRHAGKSVSPVVRSRGCDLLKDLLQADADDVRSSAAKAIGTLCQYMEENETSDLVQTLLNMGTLPDWCTRHGALLTFCSISMHCSSKLCRSMSFPSIVDLLKDSLKDDKFPVREASTKTLGRLLCYQLQSEASTLQLIQLLALALRDDSSEVRRRSLSRLKAAAKINNPALATHLSILGPAIAEALKDTNTPVRVAAERCALHVFQLTKGADNVTIAQKHLNMTGLEVRKIAKLPEESDGSESSDDDKRK
uniref:TOG domain-containing protein n=1 Tax=Oryza rufipogon TaxID=4529 RepID=A0A0E0P0K8_ORYRU